MDQHPTHITGTITLSDGSTTSFSLQADLGWQQWGNDPVKLGATVDLMEEMSAACGEYVREAEEDDDEPEREELIWGDAGNDGHRDQNASTQLVEHGFWSLGDNCDGWTIELVVQDEDLNDVEYNHRAKLLTEVLAKAHAQEIEDNGRTAR